MSIFSTDVNSFVVPNIFSPWLTKSEGEEPMDSGANCPRVEVFLVPVCVYFLQVNGGGSPRGRKSQDQPWIFPVGRFPAQVWKEGLNQLEVKFRVGL